MSQDVELPLLCQVRINIFDTAQLREKVAALLPKNDHTSAPLSPAVVGAEDDAVSQALSDALEEVTTRALTENPGLDLRFAKITLWCEMDENGSPQACADLFADHGDWRRFRGMTDN